MMPFVMVGLPANQVQSLPSLWVDYPTGNSRLLGVFNDCMAMSAAQQQAEAAEAERDEWKRGTVRLAAVTLNPRTEQEFTQ